jgi:hypothetical protein
MITPILVIILCLYLLLCCNDKEYSIPVKHNKYIRFIFFPAWYDFWIGLYFDTEAPALYVCIVPTFVIRIDTINHKENFER